MKQRKVEKALRESWHLDQKARTEYVRNNVPGVSEEKARKIVAVQASH